MKTAIISSRRRVGIVAKEWALWMVCVFLYVLLNRAKSSWVDEIDAIPVH
jgi:hypothetical protein